jgi:hypothetical protein
MGFELTLAVLVVVFCGFDAARSAAMESGMRRRRILRLLSEKSGARWGLQRSTVDTLPESESNGVVLSSRVKRG